LNVPLIIIKRTNKYIPQIHLHLELAQTITVEPLGGSNKKIRVTRFIEMTSNMFKKIHTTISKVYISTLTKFRGLM